MDFLLLSGLALCLMNFKKEFIRLVALILLTITVYTLNVSFERNLFIATTHYGNYAVTPYSLTPGDQGKLLSINDSLSSYLNTHKKAFPYAELIKKILFSDLKLSNKEILVLGAGGFSLSAESDGGNHFIYVDIDKQILPLVKKHFLSQIKGEFIAGDARHYLKTLDKKQYDVIVSDTNSNRSTLVPHLVTAEYFRAVNEALRNEGVALFNMIIRPTLNDAYSKRIDSTLRSVFGSCMAIPLHYNDKLTNVVYVCKKSAFTQDKVLYSDNLNPVSLDFHFR